MTARPSWDQYFLEIAFVVASRATCDRAHVGCVLVEPTSRSIVACGYNGSVRGMDHCDDAGHDMVNGSCWRTVHAEANAIAQAAARGVSVAGTTAYVTHFPCWGCARQLFNAQVKKIVFATAYRADERVVHAAEKIGVELVHDATVSSRDSKIEMLRVEIEGWKARCRRMDPASAASGDGDG